MYLHMYLYILRSWRLKLSWKNDNSNLSFKRMIIKQHHPWCVLKDNTEHQQQHFLCERQIMWYDLLETVFIFKTKNKSQIKETTIWQHAEIKVIYTIWCNWKLKLSTHISPFTTWNNNVLTPEMKPSSAQADPPSTNQGPCHSPCDLASAYRHACVAWRHTCE